MPLQGQRGFTLVEAAVATLCVAIVVAAVGRGLGLAGAAIREERRVYQQGSLMTSKMSELDATPIASLAAGADTIRAGGQTYVRRWSVTRADGNKDGILDAGLYLVTVSVDGDSCQTLRSFVQ